MLPRFSKLFNFTMERNGQNFTLRCSQFYMEETCQSFASLFKASCIVLYSRRNLPVKIACIENFPKSQKMIFFVRQNLAIWKLFFHFFSAHLLGPSELFVLDPRTLIRESKRGFPVMIAERSKMIIYSAKVGHKSPVKFSTTQRALLKQERLK